MFPFLSDAKRFPPKVIATSPILPFSLAALIDSSNLFLF
nr:MAG TPA: hypothetical protein [Bacteriophage sp.]